MCRDESYHGGRGRVRRQRTGGSPTAAASVAVEQQWTDNCLSGRGTQRHHEPRSTHGSQSGGGSTSSNRRWARSNVNRKSSRSEQKQP